MQIKSQSGSVVIDYYPTKTRSNVKLHDKVLTILTLNGKTFLKKVISTEAYINDVYNRIHNFKFIDNNVDHSTNAVKVSSCGWQTVTTKSRLNAILSEVKYGCSVFQKQWNWYVSFRGQTQDFIDGMILIDANHLEVA